jgi:hypothetical protein
VFVSSRETRLCSFLFTPSSFVAEDFYLMALTAYLLHCRHNPYQHAVDMPFCGGRRTISKVAKPWQALFHERLHAFFLIFCGKSAVKQAPLKLHSLSQRGLL